jgi:hypothetical protein
MKSIFTLAAAAVCGITLGCDQTTRNAAAPPADGSTVSAAAAPDTRRVDQQTMATADTTVVPATTTNSSVYGNWRTSDGFNADPDNASGAPGRSSGLGTSPTR